MQKYYIQIKKMKKYYTIIDIDTNDTRVDVSWTLDINIIYHLSSHLEVSTVHHPLGSKPLLSWPADLLGW